MSERKFDTVREFTIMVIASMVVGIILGGCIGLLLGLALASEL